MDTTVMTPQRISPLERSRMVARKKGWGPLTPEEKKAIDDIVRMVTNLDQDYALSDRHPHLHLVCEGAGEPDSRCIGSL